MLNLADIIAIIILLALTCWGAKRGLIRSVFSLGSLILSLVLALTLYPIITDVLTQSVVGDYVRLNVYKVFDQKQEEPQENDTAGETLCLPDSLESAITGTMNEAVFTVKESIAENTAAIAIKLLSMILVFILVRVLLWLAVRLLDALAHLPVLRSFNRLLGAVTGFGYGVLLLYLLLAILTFTTTLKTFNKPIELVLNSRYVSVMYNQNILLNFLK